LEPVEIWDAGLFGLGAGFVISRALLVVRDFHAFRLYPMLVLALPSFTYLGMALTVVAVLVYLRVKRLGVLAVLDAWAPCGAVLAAALCLGHFIEGTDLGMPWGFGGRLLPVQVVGAVVALGLAWLLFWELKRHTPGAKARFLGGAGRPKPEGLGYLEAGSAGFLEAEGAGFVGGLGLVLGGFVVFLMDMVSQPVQSGDGWLENGQWIAIGAMIVGVVVLQATKERV
jgi:phosphatidylglycerol:prolipoprotein diacylglycerol transferase